jgi:hypothetical protein
MEIFRITWSSATTCDICKRFITMGFGMIYFWGDLGCLGAVGSVCEPSWSVTSSELTSDLAPASGSIGTARRPRGPAAPRHPRTPPRCAAGSAHTRSGNQTGPRCGGRRVRRRGAGETAVGDQVDNFTLAMYA